MFILDVRMMMTPHAEADQVILHAMAYALRLKLTVVVGDLNDIREDRFWHSEMLPDADLAVLYNGRNHYSALGTDGRYLDVMI